MTTDNTVQFEKTVRYNYFPIGAGWCTLAFTMSSNRKDKTRSVKFGFSFCSPKDTFSKVDRHIYKTRYLNNDGSIMYDKNGNYTKPQGINKDNWHLVKKESYLQKVIPGGRTLSSLMLENNPTEIEFVVPEGKNAILTALDHMYCYVWDWAPGWRDKFFVKRGKHGGWVILGNEVVITVGDNRKEHILSFREIDKKEEVPCL